MSDKRDEVAELSAKQVRALANLLAGMGVEQAAREAGCGERTLWSWLRVCEPFKRELRLRQRQAMDSATAKLQAIAGKAITALERILDDHAAPPAAVVAAARTALDAGFRGVSSDLEELVEQLQARIEELEGAQPRKRTEGGA